jgi:hypothetical protein
MMCRLFIAIGDLDQCRLRPGPPDDLQARGKILIGVAHGYHRGGPMHSRGDPGGRTRRRDIAVAIELGRVAGRGQHERIEAAFPLWITPGSVVAAVGCRLWSDSRHQLCEPGSLLIANLRRFDASDLLPLLE